MAIMGEAGGAEHLCQGPQSVRQLGLKYTCAHTHTYTHTIWCKSLTTVDASVQKMFLDIL